MGDLISDLRHSIRLLLKNPGFTVVAVLTLALGIGANTTIFSWINSALLNPVPGIARPSEVVALTLSKPGDRPFPFTYPDLEAMRDGQQSFTGIAACSFAQMSLTGKSKPERVWGMLASANYFDVLGVRPILGRSFLPAEDEKPGGAPVAVISYRLWQRHFGGNPNIVGQTIEINLHPYTIVGVTPAVFQGSQTGVRTEIWVPIMMGAQVNPLGDLLHINTAPLAVLQALGFSGADAGAIITARAGPDGLEGTQDDVPFDQNAFAPYSEKLTPDNAKLVCYGSQFFRVISKGSASGGRVVKTVTCVISAAGDILYWNEE